MNDSFDEAARFFERETGTSLRRGELLSGHSNFHIGGPADFFFEASTLAELKTAVLAANAVKFRYRVIGGGFNLLFDDDGFRGLIIKNRARGTSVHPSDGTVETASGTTLDELTIFAAGRGLGGLEFLAGIPGTVGGAVFGNAGAFGRAVADVLSAARLLNSDGTETQAGREALEFSYRHSKLKTDPRILLGASLRLNPAPAETIRSKMDEILALRAERHPSRTTAYPGSYFKNPVLPDGCRQAAGLLLDGAGARGLRVGAAAVYSGHCNFIINEGGATAREVRLLAAEMKKRVLEKFGITLEEEVIFLPAAV
jgi:UDP-N-acetylmuramate dehydrogenase